MKKLVSIMSAVTVAVSVLTPAVFAENSDNNMRTVLESVKNRISIPEECTEFSSGAQANNNMTLYDFEWRTKSGDTYKYVDVECYDNGIISSYRNDSEGSYTKSPSIPSMSKEDAKKSAEDFLEKLNPDFPYELKVEDSSDRSLHNRSYNFSVKTYVNGIRFNDEGYISVDGENGKIGSCSIGYVPLEFPSVENAISLEDAKKTYSEKLGLEMIYRTYTDDDGKDIAYPVYVQKYDYNKYINALTGEVVDLSAKENRNYVMSAGSAKSEAEDVSGDSGLSVQEIQELENVKGLISKEDIEKQLRNNEILNIPQTALTDSVNLSKSYNKDEYRYAINMRDRDNDIYITVYADAKTGSILSYNRPMVKDKDKQVFKNDDVLRTFAGSKADEYKYNEERNSYERYVNDIRVEGDTAEVEYNGDILTRYRITYTDTEFPSTDDAMSVSDAEKVMFDKDGYEMIYIARSLENAMDIIPVYTHKSVSINPFTGTYVNYRNEEIKGGKNDIEYSDINGHYAEKYINELAYYGVGFEDGEFKPDEKITQKDYLALLTSVYDGGVVVLRNDKEQSDYVYRNSFRKDIISENERDDNSIITRDKAAVYMIRAIGADEYAKYNDIYVSPFKDVTENKGYSALLSAMGVVSGDENGNFNPNREITRAESAVMIYNYLTR